MDVLFVFLFIIGGTVCLCALLYFLSVIYAIALGRNWWKVCSVLGGAVAVLVAVMFALKNITETQTIVMFFVSLILAYIAFLIMWLRSKLFKKISSAAILLISAVFLVISLVEDYYGFLNIISVVLLLALGLTVGITLFINYLIKRGEKERNKDTDE